jgi:hypothetical protein
MESLRQPFSFGMSDLQLGCGLLQGGQAAGDPFGGLAGGGGGGGVGRSCFEVLIAR